MHRLLTATVGVALGMAVASGPTLVAQFPRAPRSDAPIISGNDIGFRVEGSDLRTGAPTGTWMLRVKGEWVEIGSAPGIRPAK